ncbi:MAG: sugar ABC transporter permease [Spirochaetales bacterium]|nr:sugar ABC transporter permease [Spirochaetales bacterium]
MTRLKKSIRNLARNRYLWLIAIPGLIYFFIFKYLPMYGVIIAFKNYSIRKGILGSDWAGLKYFFQYFNAFDFWRTLRNTLQISLYTLIFGFPAPIVLALLLNEVTYSKFRKAVQTISYIPHFMSTVIIVGILVNMVNPINGLANEFIKLFGGNPINFMGESQWFRPLYVITNIWQYAGWTSIIYLAALSGIDPMLYESAVIDGANRFQALIRITIPSLLPTIIIMFIVRMGRLMSVGMEKILLMYSPGTYETADVITTYVYRRGLLGMQYSFGAAVGLFNSMINITFLLTFNYIAKRYSETSLF